MGYGDVGPAPYTPTWRVQIWTGQTFNFMDPGRNTGTAASPTAWGPEVAFARTWLDANPTGILYLGKVAKGETGLTPVEGLDWSPTSTGEMFDRAEATARAMRADLGVAQLDAVFWMQGEQDAGDTGTAAGYGGRFDTFLEALRANWMGDSDGYVAAGRIGSSATLRNSFEVRLAQWETDQHDANLDTFPTHRCHMQADGVHYSAEGLLELGRGFFEAWATT